MMPYDIIDIGHHGVYPMKYVHGILVVCLVVVILWYFSQCIWAIYSIYILQGCFTVTWAIIKELMVSYSLVSVGLCFAEYYILVNIGSGNSLLPDGTKLFIQNHLCIS